MRPELLPQRAAIDAEDPRRPALIPPGLIHHRLEQGDFHLADHEAVQSIEVISFEPGEQVGDAGADELPRLGCPTPTSSSAPVSVSVRPSPRVFPSDTLSRLLPRQAACHHPPAWYREARTRQTPRRFQGGRSPERTLPVFGAMPSEDEPDNQTGDLQTGTAIRPVGVHGSMHGERQRETVVGRS